MTSSHTTIQRNLRWGQGVLAIAAVCVEMVFLFTSIHRLSSSKDVLLARDDDAAVFLDATTRTTWFNDVEAPYGPLYYRVSASIEPMVPEQLFKSNGSVTERELYKVYHFAMMLVSVLSLLCLAGIIAWRLNAGWPEKIALVSGLILLLGHFPVWSAHIFRGHPEMLLTVLVAAAMLFTLKIGLRESRMRQATFYLASAFWGLACATKQSAGGFALGYLLLLLLPVTGPVRYAPLARLKEAATATAVMLATYFVVGAPRTLHIVSNITRATGFVSRKSQGFSLEWAGEWLVNLGGHLVWPVLLLFVAGLAFERNRSPSGAEETDTEQLGASWWTMIVPLIPLLLILKTRLVIPSEHYMLSLIASILVIQVFVQRKYTAGLRRWCRHRLTRIAAHPFVEGAIRTVLVISLCLAVFALKGRSAAAQSAVAKQTRCIPATEQMIDIIIRERGSNRERMMVTPYFPCPLGQRCRQVWGMTFQRLQRVHPRFIGISRAYSSRFTGKVSAYDRHNRKDWRRVQAFHRAFRKGPRVVDKWGYPWQLVKRTKACGLSLWKRLPK